MSEYETTVEGGVSRRTLLKRGAIVGAATVWTVPVIQAVSTRVDRAEAMSADQPPPNHPPATPPAEPPVTPPSSTVTPTGTPAPTPTNSQSVDAATTSKAPTTVSTTTGSKPVTLTNQPQTANQTALAYTGTSLPPAATAAIGIAAVAVGAGLMAAVRREPATDGPDVEPGEDLPGLV